MVMISSPRQASRMIVFLGRQGMIRCLALAVWISFQVARETTTSMAAIWPMSCKVMRVMTRCLAVMA